MVVEKGVWTVGPVWDSVSQVPGRPTTPGVTVPIDDGDVTVHALSGKIGHYFSSVSVRPPPGVTEAGRDPVLCVKIFQDSSLEILVVGCPSKGRLTCTGTGVRGAPVPVTGRVGSV